MSRPEHYLPADYKDQIIPAYYSVTNVKQKQFLLAYGQCGSVAASIRATKINMHYHWLDKDPQYRQAFEDIQPRVTQLLRDRVIARITDVKRPSDILLMFELKRRDPSYRDNYVNINVVGPTHININLGESPAAAEQPESVDVTPKPEK